MSPVKIAVKWKIWLYSNMSLFLLMSVVACSRVNNENLLQTADGNLSPDHTLFTQVLSEHVKEGMVDYRAIKHDQRFETYIEMLRETDPFQIRAEDYLSFWINVYNAFTIKIVCDNYPLESITDLSTGGFIISHVIKKTVWDKKYVELNGEKYTLNFIEHKIIRPLGDARIHFALVCAAKSCPPLRSQAYETQSLDAQLNEQGQIFLSEPKKNRFDFEHNIVYLSKIFKWYGGDFKTNGQTVLEYISRFLPAEQAKYLKETMNNFKIKYTDYDWSLNEKNELTF
ncbi:MAG: DUF547 domain-containing protein [bacterium]